jgi:hypothetical protein
MYGTLFLTSFILGLQLFDYLSSDNVLIARIVGKLFSSNRGISHFYAAYCIDKLSRGFILGPEGCLVASKKKDDSR